MKNLRYFTFERNKYFYGKLLSVDDFESEQRYMNDKRRIINRLVNGTGVICGMNVVMVDDITISVDNGFALDFAGREIVIEQPVTKKLSVIDGFDEYKQEDEENSYLYLCVEYNETEKDQVHSIAGAKSADSDKRAEYNKYAEGYRLYLTNKEPEVENSSVERLYEETRTIYWKNGVRIKQTVPKYINAKQDLPVKITVENMGQKNPISFSYSLASTCFQDDTDKTITFTESDFKKSNKYEFTKMFKTVDIVDTVVKVSVVESSFTMAIGNSSIKDMVRGFNTVKFISGNVKEEIVKSYHKSAMDSILKNSYQQSIYLAKISVIHAGVTYTIDSIETMPFNQYLYNNTLNSALNEISINGAGDAPSGITSQNSNFSIQAAGQKQNEKPAISTGVVFLDLGIGGIAGQKFFSQEISHGLGLGPVHIIIGESYGSSEHSNIVYGDTDIFEEKQEVIQARYAARVNVDRGTFVIGMKCLEMTNQRTVKLHWTAIKDNSDIDREKFTKKLQIKPDMLSISIRDTHYFEAIVNGNQESRVNWSVKEAEGGTIDDNGLYVAPNKAGVYEISCVSIDDPSLRASTFVIVRDV